MSKARLVNLAGRVYPPARRGSVQGSAVTVQQQLAVCYSATGTSPADGVERPCPLLSYRACLARRAWWPRVVTRIRRRFPAALRHLWSGEMKRKCRTATSQITRQVL